MAGVQTNFWNTINRKELKDFGLSGYSNVNLDQKVNNYVPDSIFTAQPVLSQTPSTQSTFSNVLGENANYGGYQSNKYQANRYGKANLQKYKDGNVQVGPIKSPKADVKGVEQGDGWMANFNSMLFGEKDAKGNRDVGLADYGKGAMGVWDMYNGYQANKMLEDRIDMEREKQALDVEGAGMGYNNDVVHQQVIARQMDGTAANAAEARAQLAKDQVWQEGNLVRTSVADKKKRKSSLKV